ncbi:MAG: enoyl-CoA hydratase/isomerase family protein [Burkholderiales bacterium]|nr:enoyl-CoA hydratase/isomerase family protein [Burkholderiales bacterium]
MSSDLLASVEDGLLRVTINRPEKRNPLSRAVLAQLQQVFEEQRDNDTLVLALICGAGDRSFAAGGDLRDLEQVRTVEQARALFDLGNGAFQAIRSFGVPVVAALNGVALGGGAELAVACDLRIAAAHARIGFVQGTLNIPTAWGGGSDLAAILGPARGLELLCSARVLSASEALAAGLVEAVAPEGVSFAAFVERFIGPWMQQRPQVMRAFKWQAAARKLGMARELADPRDRDLFAAAWCHADHWRAAADILSKETKK